MTSDSKTKKTRTVPGISVSRRDHGRIISIPDEDQCLDTAQLARMEESFREWVNGSSRSDTRSSRRRMLIIFLLIRYTGAKLSEVLALNPVEDIDPVRHIMFFRANSGNTATNPREVQISEILSGEIRGMVSGFSLRKDSERLLDADPGFVRRKFYERAQACGFSKRLGGPEMIRKARGVEMMRGNMPLPAVQQMLGHSTPNLTSAYVSFSEEEIHQVTRLFMERESLRKTSARNSFFGKIRNIRRGDIQSRIEMITIDGYSITTVVTNDSMERLGLKQGRLVTAEVKAPWVILKGGNTEPVCSAENQFKGVLVKITKGEIYAECLVRISDTTELCAIVSTEKIQNLKLNKGDEIWALFNCFSVVLHVD